MQVQGVLLAVLQIVHVAEVNLLGDDVLDARTVGHAVGEIACQVGILGLHVIDDGYRHAFTRRDDERGAAGGGKQVGRCGDDARCRVA